MGKWSTILKGGKYVINNPATRSLGGAVIHPQRTLAGAGKALKSATVGAGLGYLGWESLVNDKPVVRTVADITIGKDNVDAVVDTASKTVDSVQDAVRDVKKSVSGLNGTVQQANSTFGGISDFLKNVCGSNGTDMFSNFFSNIGKGNVSGLSIVGLLAAGLMIFGRFGWLGKIGGALLAMMLIGNNSRMAQVQENPQADNQLQSGRHR
ncbi:antitoxin [Muribaculum intestinale]|uniref:antitoxin n=1 Tax=Muribaculum intestinale TaxID=1796646 RepID=UPI003516F4C7